MKKSIVFGALFIIVLLFITYGKSPQQKLVGVWEIYQGEEIRGTVTFDSDGTASSTNDSETLIWKLEQISSDTLVLKIYEDGELEEENTINFKTNDELEIIDNGKIEVLLKRKVEQVKKKQRRADNAGFEGEWSTESGYRRITIIKKSTNLFNVETERGSGTVYGSKFLAELEDGMLVGRGMYSYMFLSIEDNGKTLIFDDNKYIKISN